MWERYPPPDFINVGYTAMEYDLGVLVYGSGEWAITVGQESSIPWHDRAALTDRQVLLESRRGHQKPQLRVDIEHCVMFSMGQSGESFSRDTLIKALEALSRRGSSKQRISDMGSANMINNTQDGFRRGTQSYWGWPIAMGSSPRKN